ncbi:MAG: hypothetical protein PSX81_00140 [bacterium]|nr:hypothetical protein [bacterium]
MRQLLGWLICSLVLFNLPKLNAQVSEWRFGLIGKIAYNRLKLETPDNRVVNQKEPGGKAAGGFYIARTLGNTFFIDGSVVFTRAMYTPNFTRNNATLIDANIRFTEVNLALNLILNPRSETVNVFLFGGGQLLYRRWGEERFNNAVLANSYWPNSRLLVQAGLGAKCTIRNGLYLQPFIGLRYALEQQLVYDTSMNQYYFGAVLCFGAKGKPKNKYNKCPTDF